MTVLRKDESVPSNLAAPGQGIREGRSALAAVLSIFLSITRGIRPGLALGHGMRRACLERGRKPHFCDGGPDCVLSRAPSARGWGGGVAPKSGRRRNKKTGQWPVQTDSVLLSHQADPSLEGNNGVADGARTHDNRNHNPGLYQLSYSHHIICLDNGPYFGQSTWRARQDSNLWPLPPEGSALSS